LAALPLSGQQGDAAARQVAVPQPARHSIRDGAHLFQSHGAQRIGSALGNQGLTSGFVSFHFSLDVKWISRGVTAEMNEMNPLSCEYRVRTPPVPPVHGK